MNDDFQSRYRLLKCIALEDQIRSHNAQETSTGRVVMVHLLDDAGPAEIDTLRARLDELPGPDRLRILETATLAAGFAVVTDFLPGFTSFLSWLKERTPEKGVVHSSEPETATFSDSPAGMTELFAAAPEPEKITEAIEAVPNEPGDFTRMFQAAEPTPPAADFPARVPPLQPPGAFTPLAVPPPPEFGAEPSPQVVKSAFTTPAPSQPQAAPPPPVPESAPGEFTQLFKASISSPPPAPKAPVQPPLAPPSGLSAPAFGSGIASGHASSPWGQSPAGPPPVPLTPNPDSFGATGAMQAMPDPVSAPLPFAFGGEPKVEPKAEPLPPMPPPVPPPSQASPIVPPLLQPPVFGAASPAAALPVSPVGQASPAAPAPAGPSEYTMMIRQPTPAPPAAAPKPADTAKAQAPAKKLPLGLLIGLNIIVILAIALVLYFLFRPSPPVATEGENAELVKTEQAETAEEVPAQP